MQELEDTINDTPGMMEISTSPKYKSSSCEHCETTMKELEYCKNKLYKLYGDLTFNFDKMNESLAEATARRIDIFSTSGEIKSMLQEMNNSLNSLAKQEVKKKKNLPDINNPYPYKDPDLASDFIELWDDGPYCTSCMDDGCESCTDPPKDSPHLQAAAINDACKSCDGTGHYGDHSHDEMTVCNYCNGTGRESNTS